jgi:phosphoribosylglycinamide formyltransferase 1
MKKVKIAVLISGNGSNLQAIMDACAQLDYPAEIACVISNKKDAYGLIRANNYDIKTYVIDHKQFSTREEFDKEIDQILISDDVEVVCLAGFMRILSDYFVDKWSNKIINIHPSLLPSFKGVDAIKQAFYYGVKITGCTVHYVVPEMDAGPIILQKSLEIKKDDSLENITDKIHFLEHKCYVEALKIVCDNILNNN